MKAWYSNFGQNLGVVAPGGANGQLCHDDQDIWSTTWPFAAYDCGGNGYETLAGTSMAAPHAAAVAALVKARYGTVATPGFIYAKIKGTADDLGLPGPDPVYGHGRVNAKRALS